MTLGTVTPSLAGTGKQYLTAQVRVVDAGHCRYQSKINDEGVEVTVTASATLTAWLATVPATGKSMAGTGAMYMPCQIRPEKAGMQVQVLGPAPLNMPFGAEYVCHGWKGEDALAAMLGTSPSEPNTCGPAPEAHEVPDNDEAGDEG